MARRTFVKTYDHVSDLLSPLKRTRPSPSTTGGGGGASPYWYEDWTSAAVPTNWLTEVRTANTTYSFVADPTGTNGTVLRLRDVYDASIGTAYNAAALQLVSLYRTASLSNSGYQSINEETWYRVKVMWPSGNYWCNGDEVNWTIEWHTDDNTQNPPNRGNSPGLYVRGGYPTTSAGTSSPPGMVLRWASGDPASPTNTYWPSTATGAYANTSPIPIVTNTWYDHLFRVVWSTSAVTGRLEWYTRTDSGAWTTRVAQNMATLYTNPANFNSQSFHTFGLYNYRYNVTNTSTTYFDLTAAGPSQASVGA